VAPPSRLRLNYFRSGNRITALESEIASIKAELTPGKAELARGDIAALNGRPAKAQHRGMDMLRIIA
jgi:hypothetical protein